MRVLGLAAAAAAALALGAPWASHAAPFPGPDGFGYAGSAIPFNLRDVSGTGVDVGLDADEETVVDPIGFSFSFYGVAYNEVEISSNGFISFTPTGIASCCGAQPIPTAGTLDNFIAAYWDDLAPNFGGVVRTATLGSVGSREYVVGFYAVPDFDYPDDSINTFEIILHEGSNDIELQFLQVQYDSIDNKTTGIENVDGSDGIELLHVSAQDPNRANGDLLFFRQGFCFSSSGTNCGAQAVQTPEPAALGLLTLGLAGLSALRRRRAPV